jgi:superkiller protein 3
MPKEDSAIYWYKKALNTDPSYAEAFYNLGNIYYYRATESAENGVYYDSAIVYLEKAVKLKPVNASYQSKVGDAYYYAASTPKHLDSPDFYQKAVLHYKEAIRLDSTQFLAMNNLGVSYISLQKFTEGISIFEEALKRDTAYTNLYEYNLACIYSRQSVDDKALEYLARSIISGYTNLAHISEDTDLDNIRSLPKFKMIIEKHFKPDEINKYPGLFKKEIKK